MFTIAMKDLALRLKDRRSLVMMLLMPLVLTAILGSALGGNFGDDASMPATTVGVAYDTEDERTNQWVDGVLPSEDVTVVSFDNGGEVENAMNKGEVDVGVLLPNEWGEKLGTADVTVLTDPDKTLQASIIESMLTSYIDRVQAVTETTDRFATALAEAGDVEVAAAAGGFSTTAISIAEQDSIQLASGEKGEQTLNGMQYYAAAMGVMFLLFNATVGARSILQERHTQTLARLAMTPVRSYHIIGGKFLGTLSFTLVQFSLFLAATYFMFQVSWGENLWQVSFIVVAYAIAVSGLAMMLASLVKEEKTADSIGGIGVQILALLGGSMIPVAAFPGAIQSISNVIPNKWALDSFLEIMTGTAWGDLYMPAALLVLFGAACLGVGATRLQVR
ncbi:ABC transporter permease [Halobacillus salinus]|uniref:ABC transporter permease n=1 Tax=Halobacillus salinus TaxID=192814 RepID=A0A4Z0GTU6_9BACI|nr:ABC transporter permease [Halobacillus salinus]TGB01010.1 ABC transporter permease [Halobacillus salinus]